MNDRISEIQRLFNRTRDLLGKLENDVHAFPRDDMQFEHRQRAIDYIRAAALALEMAQSKFGDAVERPH